MSELSETITKRTDYLPGDVRAIRYSGRNYQAKVSAHPRYRVRVLRASVWAGEWELLGRVTWENDSGNVRTREVVLATSSSCAEAPHLVARNDHAVRAITAVGEAHLTVRWPRNKTDTVTPRKLHASGWRSAPSGETT